MPDVTVLLELGVAEAAAARVGTSSTGSSARTTASASASPPRYRELARAVPGAVS